MDTKITSDHTPVGYTRDVKRPRRPFSTDLPGRRRSSSSEEPTNKRPRREQNSIFRTDARRVARLVKNNVANDQSQVQYGDRYNEVHYHNHGSHESHISGRRIGPHSLYEAKSAGKEPEYIARVMNDLSFGRMGLRKSTIAPALADTCQWLLKRQEYIDWRSLDRMCDHHGFMWIKSKPGAGKSTLMKFLLEATQTRYSDEKVVSFFFNARGDVDEASLIGLYRHLLHQLLHTIPRLIPAVIDDINRLVTEGWQLLSLQDIFRKAVLDLKFERLVCFIDALDESSEDEIRNLIDFFEELGNATVLRRIDFRVCLSSRHYPHVELKRCQYLNLDDQREHHQDIALYIQNKLSLRRGGVSDGLLSSIQQRAKGVFLWAVLVTQILKRDYQRGNIHKVRDRLERIPDGLHNLFHEMVHRNLDDPDDNKNLVSILQLIAFAYRPLTPAELYFAVRSEHADFDMSQLRDLETMQLFILNCSKGLAELTPTSAWTTQTVQFIHESVRDYWVETGYETLTFGHGGPAIGSAHDRLKGYCLRWISSNVIERLRTPIQIDDTATSMFERPLAQFEGVASLPYAVANVIQHAEAACTHGVPQDDFSQSFPLEKWCGAEQLAGDWPFDPASPVSLTEILVFKRAKVLLAIELQRNKGRLLSCQQESALRVAISQFDSKCVRMLLESCASVESSVEQKMNTLEMAVRKHNIAALELMFEHGTHAIPLQNYVVILTRAAKGGLRHVVKVLLDHIDMPTEGNAELESAIQGIFLPACMRGNEIVVHACLQKQANPNSFIHGDKTTVRACLEENADPKNRVHGRPLFHAVSVEGHAGVLSMLFKAGVDPDVEQGKHYYNALIQALRDCRYDIFHVLASYGVDVMQQPRWFYWSVVEDFTLRRRGDAIRMLLHGVRGFCVQDREVYVEALRSASSRGFDEIVQILRDRGVTLPEEGLSTIECASHDT
jgi:hypothetical protein